VTDRFTGFSAIPLFHAALQPKWPRGWTGLTGYSSDRFFSTETPIERDRMNSLTHVCHMTVSNLLWAIPFSRP